MPDMINGSIDSLGQIFGAIFGAIGFLEPRQTNENIDALVAQLDRARLS
jgi:hypothetical protein